MNSIDNIVQKFGYHLFNFINGRVSAYEDAQDIYQEVLLKIMNKSDQVADPGSLKSWLFTVTRNQIIDYYRSKKYPMELDSQKLDEAIQTEENETYLELEGCLNDFIERLPEEDKRLLILTEFEGISQKALSESLNMNYITLRSKVQRSRRKIREMIFDACSIIQDGSGRLVDCSPKSTGCASTTKEDLC